MYTLHVTLNNTYQFFLDVVGCLRGHKILKSTRGSLATYGNK